MATLKTIQNAQSVPQIAQAAAILQNVLSVWLAKSCKELFAQLLAIPITLLKMEFVLNAQWDVESAIVRKFARPALMDI